MQTRSIRRNIPNTVGGAVLNTTNRISVILSIQIMISGLHAVLVMFTGLVIIGGIASADEQIRVHVIDKGDTTITIHPGIDTPGLTLSPTVA